MNQQLVQHWGLNPEVAFLNHGSFGAAPHVVLEAQRQERDAQERDPIHYLAPERSLYDKLDAVRSRLGAFLGCPAADLAFVRNATEGVNAVLRSFALEPGDRIVHPRIEAANRPG